MSRLAWRALAGALRSDRWFRPLLRQNRAGLILAVGLGWLALFCATALMFSSGYLISRAAERPGNVMLIYVPIVLTRAFGIGRPVFQYAQRLLGHNWVLGAVSRLRLRLYWALEAGAGRAGREAEPGALLGLLVEDIGRLQNLYLRLVLPCLAAWLLYVFVVLWLGFFSLWFGLAMLVLLAGLVIIYPLAALLANGLRQARRKRARQALYRTLTDNVLGLADWIFAQRGQDFRSRYERENEGLRRIEEELNRAERRRNLFIQACFGLVLLVLLGWAAGRFPDGSAGSGNWIAAFVLAFFPLVDAFAPLSSELVKSGAYAESIRRLNALPEEAARPHRPVKLPAGPLTLRVSNLSYTHPGQQGKIFDKLSLSLGPGQKVAVLGRSGCGKSTLAALLRGDLCPDQGEVTLNGSPVCQFGEARARYIGVIQQEAYLFNTTLLNNLRLGRPEASLAEVWAALANVGLAERLQALPEGLDSLVDEGGLRFSGGERRRLALARLLLLDTPIVILDEPSVGLDPLAERALLEVFFRNMDEKTVFWITHHLAGVELADRVLFIENGKIALDGPPARLAAEEPRYRELLAFDRGE